MKRIVRSFSFSSLNPDTAVVLHALKDVPRGERSAKILRWAAAYILKEENTSEISIGIGMTEEEIDALLDDF